MAVMGAPLNADWVVLSACNTMAGDKPGAEALSGLARAFFYAGARALMVSHWSVESTAAARLTTSTFDLLRRNPAIGRSLNADQKAALNENVARSDQKAALDAAYRETDKALLREAMAEGHEGAEHPTGGWRGHPTAGPYAPHASRAPGLPLLTADNATITSPMPGVRCWRGRAADDHEAADEGRGAPDRGQFCQAAGTTGDHAAAAKMIIEGPRPLRRTGRRLTIPAPQAQRRLRAGVPGRSGEWVPDRGEAHR
jgi:hypothetical protein